MPSILVLDASGAAQTIQSLPAVGPNTKVNALPFTIATDDPLLAAAQAATPAGTNTIGAVVTPACMTVTVGFTRPADTNAYAVNDAYANSTSSPTVGGFTFANAARAAAKTCKLSDMIITNSNPASTGLQGEVWIFDTAVTAINDNAAFAVSDAEILTLVGKVAFSMATGVNNNSVHVQGINIDLTTVSVPDLRFLVRVTNVYTPASAEVLTFRAKFEPID